jgi:hypothetical protein
LENLILAEEILPILVAELSVLSLALHLVEMIHYASWKVIRSVPPRGDQAMMEGELQFPPVQVLELRLVVETLIVEFRQIPEIEVLEAGVEVP